MLKKFLLLTVLFFICNNSYWYEFEDITIRNNIWNYKFYNYYNIDNLRFMVQAPLKTKENWDKNNESCEEAALFIANANTNNVYFDFNSADREFENMNNYEELKMWIIKDKKHNKNSNITYLRDISIEKMQELAIWFYWYDNKTSHIIKNPSIETIRYLIAHDYIVIAPSNTLTLWNPNFNQTTDSYHVIDLVWYDKINIVSFDPGTSKWANYKYENSIIIKWIRENWNKILLLEWKLNQNKLDFQDIYFTEKSKLFMNRLDELIEKNPNNKKNILKIVSQNLRKKSNNKDENISLLISKLLYTMDNKFDEMAFDTDEKLND